MCICAPDGLHTQMDSHAPHIFYRNEPKNVNVVPFFCSLTSSPQKVLTITIKNQMSCDIRSIVCVYAIVHLLDL